MSDQQGKGRTGRPSKRVEPYRRTSMELPVSLLSFLETVDNRPEYIVQAIREKRARDQEQKVQS